MTTDDLEAHVLRALADPDSTIRRMAAVRAHKVLPRSTVLLDALESQLAHEDKYLRRAAAASYVALHELGAGAPALARLREDPSELVVLTARGSLLDAGHEIAELNFVVRALARATRDPATPFAKTAARWHQFLWLYSPNPRAANIMKTIASEDLDREADQVRDALGMVLRERAMPAQITQLQIYLDGEDDGLLVQGFVHGQHTWSAGLRTPLAAFRQLHAFEWDVHDAPWPAMFVAGCFALAVARAVEAAPSGFIAGAVEREIGSCVGWDGEQIFIGFLRATGISYVD